MTGTETAFSLPMLSQRHSPRHGPPGSGLWRRRSWLRAVAGGCALPVLGLTLDLLAEDPPTEIEYKIKAGYLLNFTRFMVWPDSAFEAATSPFIIAVADQGEALPTIQRVLQGQAVGGHPVRVAPANAADLAPDAHILLLTRASGLKPEVARKVLGVRPTLLVGETEQFAERGGTIAFVRERERIRLNICLEHAARSGLQVSSKLSSVARAVKSQTGSAP